VIRTLDLRQVVLPNLTLISVPIKTFSSETVVRLTAVFGVHYDSDISLVVKVITDTVNSCDFVLEKDTTKTFVSNFADSYIELKSMFSFDPKCGLVGDVAIGMINEKINSEFPKNNIKVPFNTLTLNFEDDFKKQIIKNI
jgi:small-conductance mechanosensitive channel